jgi:hypothetical protein
MNAQLKVIGLIALLVALFILGGYITVWLWGWIVPDVFAGAVAHGTLPAVIGWSQGAKLSIGVWLMFGSASSKK